MVAGQPGGEDKGMRSVDRMGEHPSGPVLAARTQEAAGQPRSSAASRDEKPQPVEVIPDVFGAMRAIAKNARGA